MMEKLSSTSHPQDVWRKVTDALVKHSESVRETKTSWDEKLTTLEQVVTAISEDVKDIKARL